MPLNRLSSAVGHESVNSAVFTCSCYVCWRDFVYVWEESSDALGPRGQGQGQELDLQGRASSNV